jgi:hypothetical protein
MTKNEINNQLREFARSLSPSAKERGFVSNIYSAFQSLLGEANCLQIGSYARFTAVTPVHDLDILYVIGEWNTDWPTDSYSPQEVIGELEQNIRKSFKNPEACSVNNIEKQTHSVSVTFECDGQEFSVDVVPAYCHGTNEFGYSTYKVPEILKKKRHDKRREMYESKTLHAESIGWIDSDPRGYISVATQVGGNNDFRKAVKVAKFWKDQLKQTDEELKLKSFHIEQVITNYFLQNPTGTVFDALFTFFVDFPNTVLNANQIADRISPDKFIDDYVAKMSGEVRERLMQARDGVLIRLEEVDEFSSIEEVFMSSFRERMDLNEAYLFDDWIPVLLEPEHSGFDITADITDKQGGFVRALARMGIIDSGRYLRFKRPTIDGCEYKWKVKNDDACDQPRGEITDGHTLNVPENTKYVGRHYVECYVVRDGVCVAKARHGVSIQRGSGRVKIQR